jgi:hypothetical protein
VKRLENQADYDALLASPPQVINNGSTSGVGYALSMVVRGYVTTGQLATASAGVDNSSTTALPSITTTEDKQYVLTVAVLDDDDIPELANQTPRATDNPDLYLALFGGGSQYIAVAQEQRATAGAGNVGWTWGSFEQVSRAAIAMTPAPEIAPLPSVAFVGTASVTVSATAEDGGIPIEASFAGAAEVTVGAEAESVNYVKPRREPVWVYDVEGNQRVVIR